MAAQTCPVTGKVMYPDKLSARIALATGAGEKGSKRAYRCPFCRRWHTTSQRKRGKR